MGDSEIKERLEFSVKLECFTDNVEISLSELENTAHVQHHGESLVRTKLHQY